MALKWAICSFIVILLIGLILFLVWILGGFSKITSIHVTAFDTLDESTISSYIYSSKKYSQYRKSNRQLPLFPDDKIQEQYFRIDLIDTSNLFEFGTSQK
jgi:hypothetical protein